MSLELKRITLSECKFEKKGNDVPLTAFKNFPNVNSYLWIKTFAWKWDYTISPKLQMLWCWQRPLKKTLAKYYYGHLVGNSYPLKEN